MENPNTWNAVMKAINRFDWDHKIATDEVAVNLINYLDTETLLTSKPQALQFVVLKTLQQHIEKLKTELCGSSLGVSMYYKLKAIGAVE